MSAPTSTCWRFEGAPKPSKSTSKITNCGYLWFPVSPASESCVFNMLKYLRRASVLVFRRRRILNPKMWTLNPKTLKPQVLKPKQVLNQKTLRTRSISAISPIMFDNMASSMLQSGQTTWSVRTVRDSIYIYILYNPYIGRVLPSPLMLNSHQSNPWFSVWST